MLLVLTKRSGFPVASILPKPQLAQFPFESGISRLRYKPDLFDFSKGAESIVELTNDRSPLKTWEDCCAERASQLLAMGKEKYYLSYSGGIDSTTMLVSLLKHWPEQERRRIFVLMSETSILENPNFFDRYISKLNITHIQAQVGSDLLDKDSVLVTGELGDQLFGSDILAEAAEMFGEECLRLNYERFAPELIERRGGSRGNGKAVFDNLRPIVEECPFPVKSLHDFFWWFNFTQKWQYVKYRHLELRNWDLEKRYGSAVLHFFDTLSFQKWSLGNHDLKIKDTWESYKFTAKEYIHDFTRYAPDLELKKVQSLKRTYMLNSLRVGITDRYETVLSLEGLKPHVRS